MKLKFISAFILLFISGNVYAFGNDCYEAEVNIIEESVSSVLNSEYYQFQQYVLKYKASIAFQLPDPTDCTISFAYCLDWVNEMAEENSFDFPGGTVLHQLFVGFCAGRYLDCINNN